MSSRIASSLVREPVEATIRKRLSVADRINILDRQRRCCPECGKSLVEMAGDIEGAPFKIYKPMIDEHIVPLELGGSNALSNRALLCVPCAKAKTREDIKRIAKAKRLSSPSKRQKRKIEGRGFSKALSRGFDGKVKDRG